MATDKERATDIRVGLFVAFGLALLTLVIFLIGQERRLFEKPVYLKALFDNVSGLKVGAQVRLAGYDVGIVSAIELPEPDPDAEKRLVSPVDPSKLEGDTVLALEGPTTFDPPMNVTVTAFDTKNQLSLRVRVHGEDGWGNAKAQEDLRVRVSSGRMTVTGVKVFKKIDKLEVLGLEGNSEGTLLQVGVGRLKKVTVVMRISSEVLNRIRQDSEARVDSMGLLGDKTIDISIGSQALPPLRDGDTVRSAVAVDFNTALADAQHILDNVVVSTDELRKLLAGFTAAGGEEALVAAVRSIQDIADEIQNGQGLLHQLVFDPKSGAQYQDIVAEVKSSTEKLDSNLAHLDQLLGEVKTGDGLLHAVIYGDDGDQAVKEAQLALAEAKQLLNDVRTKRGVVHNLIYDEDRGEFVTNLNTASADVKIAAADAQKVVDDVKTLVADVKAGKGTIGALLVDPTVYEDLKVLLGNARRNDAVKAIVRAAIANEDAKANAPVTPK
jgi:ABC-type transporter Mla subunit MlaD